MNLSLTDEQQFLRDAARGALSRFKTHEAARAALEDPAALPDLWPTAVEAGWPGLLASEEVGGAGLGLFDAMLVAEELGRVLAPVPFLGVVPAIPLLEAAGDGDAVPAAAGEMRPVLVPAAPPTDLDEPAWQINGSGDVLRATVDGSTVTITGKAMNIADAVGADLLVLIALDEEGRVVVAAVAADASGVDVRPAPTYDATRPLVDITLQSAVGRRLTVDEEALASAWDVTQALVAAEAVGTASAALEAMTAYAKERFTFGRAIGSFQAVKHEIVEVLRQVENARSLLYYAGWAGERRPEELALAASAARTSAGAALDFAARANINVHGGIGATWEHDAPLTFRRAQSVRRLYGGHGRAADRVSGQLLLAADAGS